MTSIRSNSQVRTHHADRRHTECETTPTHQSRRRQRADGFERTSTETTRPTTGTSSLDANFNFSIDVGGQRIEGNLLELILAAVLEKMLGTLGGGSRSPRSVRR